MFTKASETLYVATKKRAVFGEVTILLPTKWNYDITSESQGESFNTVSNKIDTVINLIDCVIM